MFLSGTVVAFLLCLMPALSWAELPKRDLLVELRQVQEGQETQGGQDAHNGVDPGGAAYTVGTAPAGAVLVPQQVRVRNGEKASLRLLLSTPMQWTQSVGSQASSVNVSSTGAATSTNLSSSNTANTANQSLTWMEAGQSITLTPRWPGGKQPAMVELEMQSAVMDERTSSDLPAITRQQVGTTVSAPLNQWVTIASSGSAASSGRYSSAAGVAQARRLVQIRVSPQ
jgi:hypothetical protein